MKIKIFESYGKQSLEEKINEFCKERKVINVVLNTTYIPRSMYADGRGCDGTVLYTYTVLYDA